MYENSTSFLKDIPWYFLKKLLKINAECRRCIQLPVEEAGEYEETDDPLGISLSTTEDTHSGVNALDLIVALFLCADSFLQQEMSLRMSMCQFSVPLLLPHSNNSQCSLMLWALRGIVKEWCPHVLSESKGFIEDVIIEANIPLFSFVRLKNSSLSKSQILNHILSQGQQNQNIFIHRDMEGGTIKRQISDGLVEICWFLPSGKENLDIFPEPVAFANLRGDISESHAQFSFLVHVSAAIFVFLDKVEENEQETLTSTGDVKNKLFLVVNGKEQNREEMMSLKTTLEKIDFLMSNVMVKKSKENGAEFSRKLCGSIKKSLVNAKTENGPNIIQTWKSLSRLQMNLCRINTCDDKGTEDYKSKIQEKEKEIKKQQAECKLSEGLQSFINNISTSKKEERDFFLKWLKLKLDSHSREKLSELRNQFKEQCKNKNPELIKELDQALLESSLGIEHFMREMGLIYEFLQENTEEISCLPHLAAEMVMDGHPLELLDGDASNVPEKWLLAVLNEVHKKVGNRSRLLVLAVLGVQSSGKSTLLNTMFGVQFPVSSGRCTRGAYMIFLRVNEDYKSELDYDFIVLIDTEGLKSPQMAQLENSYEHDNQLATFVIGLSDIAIINIAMENSTEMKDILQIAVHAFLRMKEIGKKPVCHFVHQNVGVVSAHSKCMTERKYLLDQLNEMTQIASQMEKLPTNKLFTDILDYDVEKNNWNIPGLWHGTPPMAPVNTGYSETVAEFKKYLLETIKSNKTSEPNQIPEFLKWVTSLWRAVKYENFIFSFRNTLVAHAYDNLCKEFNQWEWKFRKEIYSWQQQTEVEILNIDTESNVEVLTNKIEKKKQEVSDKITNEEKKMKENLDEYYKRTDRRVNLIEKYKVDFQNSIDRLANEIQLSVTTKLECTLQLIVNTKKALELQRKYRVLIEEAVMKLLYKCKEASTLSEDELTKEFEKMWSESTANLSVNVDLNNEGLQKFKAKSKHIDGWQIKVPVLKQIKKKDLQFSTDSFLESSTQLLESKVEANQDYHDSFTRELLENVHTFVDQNHKHHKTNTKYEIDLKLHVCGIASREFLKMHQKFLSNLNPKNQLEKFKPGYLSDFIDLYKERDDCQRKANDYIKLCIKPAVEDFINRSLGVDIVDEILTSQHSAEYSSRSFFQYNIQKELLEKDDFECFVKYINKYEIYVKNWIYEHIKQQLKQNETLNKLKNRNLKIITEKIADAIKAASKRPSGVPLPDDTESTKELIKNIREHLVKEISIPVEAEKTIMFQIQSTCHPFINSVKMALENLANELENEYFTSEGITEILKKLTVKPQDELFKRVFGCGNQCPFCKAPCEAGGKEHKLHSAAIHRPQGLGRYNYIETTKLVPELCTTLVHSNAKFKNSLTDSKFHPYKEYRTFYPDWHIPPDPSIEASDYWKYILVKYNDQFAKKYQAKPADVPKAWRRISQEDALKGLNDAFNIKMVYVHSG
uniref:VLIG-type G domain-containing protein n=1 Tax=Poecilia latipinna TaxID=48699 RepID=A0A3B3ULW7_9TELE